MNVLKLCTCNLTYDSICLVSVYYKLSFLSVMLRVNISYVNFAVMIGTVTFTCTCHWQRNRASLQLIDHSGALVRLGCYCVVDTLQ